MDFALVQGRDGALMIRAGGVGMDEMMQHRRYGHRRRAEPEEQQQSGPGTSANATPPTGCAPALHARDK